MGKDPTGSRPTPTVASGKGSNRWDTDPHGGTDKSRESHTKTPTGDRPVPGVARHEPPHAVVPGDVKKAIKRTPMPTPNKDAHVGASKKEGGGSY